MEKTVSLLEVPAETAARLKALAQKDNSDIENLMGKLISVYLTFEAERDNLRSQLDYYRENELEVLTMGDTIGDGVVVIDGEGTIYSINRVFAAWVGLSMDSIVGNHARFLDSLLDKAISSRVIKKKQISNIITTVISNNKRVLITAAPLYGSQGQFTRIVIAFRDITELIKLKEQLEISEMARKGYHGEIESLKKHLFDSELIGNSATMIQLKDLLHEVAKSDATILITGETGVGKEIVARDIYRNGLRKDKPFIRVNCAAIPETLLESELFGYEKGAFTGALSKDKVGLFESANKGTILLDEIGELPFNLQSKILRVLQERELMRIGGTHPIKLDVHVIASTNRNLEEMINQGKFRQDLYFRLNVIPISVPPLRARTEDIFLLADHFLRKANQKYGKNKNLEVSGLSALEQYDWPGNVRELQNVIERLVVLGDNLTINEKDIFQALKLRGTSLYLRDGARPGQAGLKYLVSLYEKQILEQALLKYGSTHKAARALGVTQPTILRKAKLLGIRNWR